MQLGDKDKNKNKNKNMEKKKFPARGEKQD